MMYCPFAHMMMNNYFRASVMNSMIRVFHASPNAPDVDIYANGNLIVKGLSYKEFSPYLPVSPGRYNIKVFPSGQTMNPVINTNLNVPENTILNIAAIGTLPDISLYPIPEPTTAQSTGKPCVRFVHLSPNAPAVDIRLADGSKVFSNVVYKEITDYVCIPAGTYTFTVNPAGTENVVLTVPNVRLAANNYYTIYAVGLVGSTPALEAIAALEPR